MKHTIYPSQKLLQVRKLFISAVSLLLLLTSAHANEASIELLSSPASVNSSLSRIVSDESGRVYLSWVTQKDDLASLYYAQLVADGWSEPVLISEGSNWFVNWADFPALSVNAGHMATYWLEMSAQGTYDYDIQGRFYDADASSWSEASVIHNDGISAEHGFVSMLPMGSGRTFLSWLDGRETAVEDGAMTLRGGIFDQAGALIDEWELDHRVCDCCQTSSAMTAKGPIVVYRDRSENEIRDIYMTRYLNSQWSGPKPVHSDDWQIAGCPVNGPAVAANESHVAVSWFTAKDDTPKVQLVVSQDSGESFSAPVVVATPNTNGRVGTVILNSGQIVVSWIDTTQTDSKIVLSLFSAQGQFIERTEVATTSASRRSGFPIIEEVGDSVYVTWTDISDSPQVKIAKVSYAGK